MQNKREQLESLKKKWISFKSNNKKVRIRDAANHLGVSEAELLSTDLNRDIFFLSINNYSAFFQDILSLKKIMFLIRSDFVVHEKIVITKDIKLLNNQFIYNKPNNDTLLKFDTKLFKYAFFESKKHRKIDLKSFQIFNSQGYAILKIYLKSNDKARFDEIGLKYKSEYNYELQSADTIKSNKKTSIKDVDLYFKDIVKNSEEKKYCLEENPLRKILLNASKLKIPIQIHAIGLGTIQYHRDVVKKIIDYGPWVNVIDKNFNLHVLEKNLNKFILTKYKNSEYCLIDFFDQEKRHVLGITSIIGNENKFSKIINKLGEAK